MKMIPLEDIPYVRLVDTKTFAFRLFDDRRYKPSLFDIMAYQKAKKDERLWNEAISSIIYERRLLYFDPAKASDYIAYHLNRYCIKTMKVYKPVITVFTEECGSDALEGKAGVVKYSVNIVCPAVPKFSPKTYFDIQRIDSVVERYYAIRGFRYIKYFVEKYNEATSDLFRLLSLQITVE